MCSALGPPHLLLLDHALADDLVHRRLRWGTGDRLARLIAYAIIRNKRLIDLDVPPEVVEPFGDFLPCCRRVFLVCCLLEVLKYLEHSKEVAMPEQPFQPVQISKHTRAGRFVYYAKTLSAAVDGTIRLLDSSRG